MGATRAADPHISDHLYKRKSIDRVSLLNSLSLLPAQTTVGELRYQNFVT
jgi:hypothetical protein